MSHSNNMRLVTVALLTALEVILGTFFTVNFAGIAKIGYYSNLNEEIRDTFDENVSITVPKHPSGTAVVLVIEAVADNDDGTPNTVTKTGWEKYYFVYE